MASEIEIIVSLPPKEVMARLSKEIASGWLYPLPLPPLGERKKFIGRLRGNRFDIAAKHILLCHSFVRIGRGVVEQVAEGSRIRVSFGVHPYVTALVVLIVLMIAGAWLVQGQEPELTEVLLIAPAIPVIGRIIGSFDERKIRRWLKEYFEDVAVKTDDARTEAS